MSQDSLADMVVLGGCGHVGLPLGLAFAAVGLRVTLSSTNPEAVRTIQNGSMPHREVGAQVVLDRVLSSGRLSATTEPECISRAQCLVVVVGTPVDEHLNPDPQAVVTAIMIGEHLGTASSSFCAARSSRASLAWWSASSIEWGRPLTWLFALSGSQRAGRWRSCTPCHKSSPHAPYAVLRSRRRPLQQPCQDHRSGEARGGRVGQAVHQLVSIHQIRRSQSALHDGQ